jgi:hypothetical protein
MTRIMEFVGLSPLTELDPTQYADIEKESNSPKYTSSSDRGESFEYILG